MKHRKKAQFRTKPELSLLQFDHLTLNWFFFIHKIKLLLNNDCYMELLYHSSFLNLLGEEYKISNNDLIKLANEAHTYIVNVMNNEYDENRAVELKRELQKVTEEDSLKVVEKIIGA